MTTDWAVTASAETCSLDAANRGSITLTVTNRGPDTDTVVVDVQPGEGARRSWFAIDKPQREVGVDDTASFVVQLAIPTGTPAGRYELVGRAYSAGTPPEESSRMTGRIAFEVRPTRHRGWLEALIAVVLVLVVGGAAAFVLGGQGSPAPAPSASPHRPARSRR